MTPPTQPGSFSVAQNTYTRWPPLLGGTLFLTAASLLTSCFHSSDTQAPALGPHSRPQPLGFPGSV